MNPTPKLRVVINGRFLAQSLTGVQRYARETVMAMDALLTSQPELFSDVRLELAVPVGAEPFALQSIPTVVVGKRGGHRWEQIELLRYARGAYLVSMSYSGPVLKRRQLVTLHDAMVPAMPSSFSWKYRAFQHIMVRAMRWAADRFMTVSEFSQHEIGPYFGVKNILVGLEGWRHALADGDGADTLAKYGLVSKGYFFAAGSLKPNKNFKAIDKALQLLGPGFTMPVAIAGAKDARIFQHADAGSQNVKLLGYVSDAELGHLYKNAAWFVFPSTYEGFGLPAIEAMGNGCPVLATRAASIPEVCRDAALYFDPDRPDQLAALMRQVVDNPGLRDSLVEPARKVLAHYTWEANAAVLARHLASAAKRNARFARPEEAITGDAL
jgi:glycosyltransferase involved in cell wall biosynthesis